MSFSSNHINYMERAFLESCRDSSDLRNSHGWLSPINQSSVPLQISHIPYIDQSDPSQNRNYPSHFIERMVDSLAGLQSLGYSAIYVIAGEQARTRLYLLANVHSASDQMPAGAGVDDQSLLESLLHSSYPGIQTRKDDYSALSSFIKKLNHSAIITGTPTQKVKGNQTHQGMPIDRLIRSMHGETWAYVVVAKPLEVDRLQKFGSQILYELQLVSDAERSANTADARAGKYKQLLNRLWHKVQLGKTQGMWQSIGYLLADQPQAIMRLKAAAKSVFGGASSIPDPIRILDVQQIHNEVSAFKLPNVLPENPPGKVAYLSKYLSLVNSSELSAMVHLPTREVSGFHVQPQAKFDVTPHDLARNVTSHDLDSQGSIDLGEIVNQGQMTGNQYTVTLDSLKRHGMVVGTTGSGKTNTIFNLLEQFTNKGIPFLVIEPAKTEYRALLNTQLVDSELGSRLQIFTLGNEKVSPFRVNPFEVLPGISVQTHIDYLKSVFNASFVMYAPMPQVLEQCIHEVYEDKGWNLVTGDNDRGHHPSAFPTLTDLHQKVSEVVYLLGYEENIKMNIEAALRTRIDSLRIGGKGLMLDTALSFPIDSLLKTPTILELDDVGDDDEKGFLIGLILMRLYEYYRSVGQQEDGKLRHITVIEEAHRLLKASPPATDPEAASMAKKAVESFASMLAEVRAYGEGFIVAEQIPSKLASDVIKNTNLKIAHRLVAEEDRKLVGGTMALNSEQERWVGLSQVGEAAVFSGMDDNPLRIKVACHPSKEKGFSTGPESDEAVAARMQRLNEHHAAEFDLLASSRKHPQFRKITRLSRQVWFQTRLCRFVLSILTKPDSLAYELHNLREAAKETLHREMGDGDDNVKSLFLQGLDYLFDEIGKKKSVPFSELHALKGKIFVGVAQYAKNELKFKPEIEGLTNDFNQAFSDLFLDLEAPYTGCEFVCKSKGCLFRVLLDYYIELYSMSNEGFLYDGDDPSDAWKKFQKILSSMKVEAIGSNESGDQSQKATLCLAVQTADQLYGGTERESILRNLFPLRKLK